MGLGWQKKLWDSQASPLKGPQLHPDLLRLTPFALQHRGSSLKGTSGTQRGTEVSGIRVRSWRKLPPRQKCRQRPLYLLWALARQSHGEVAPCLNLFQPGSEDKPRRDNYQRVCPIQFTGPPKQHSHPGNSGFSTWRAGLGTGFRPSKPTQTSNSWAQPLYLSLNSLSPGTSRRHLHITL